MPKGESEQRAGVFVYPDKQAENGEGLRDIPKSNRVQTRMLFPTSRLPRDVALDQYDETKVVRNQPNEGMWFAKGGAIFTDEEIVFAQDGRTRDIRIPYATFPQGSGKPFVEMGFVQDNGRFQIGRFWPDIPEPEEPPFDVSKFFKRTT